MQKEDTVAENPVADTEDTTPTTIEDPVTIAIEDVAAENPTTENPITEAAPKTLLVDVPLDSNNAALNVMIAFMTVAQKRGAFTMQESAKLWECISYFTGSEPQTAPAAAAAADAKTETDAI